MEWISHVMQDLFILTKIYPISILFQSWNNLCSQLPNFEYHKFITCSYRYSAVKYYSLNKIYIYTGSYFHTVKIWKMLFSQMEKFLAIVTTRYVVHASLKFLRNIFENKENAINRKCFWLWVWNLFDSWDRIFHLKYITTHEITVIYSVKTFRIL